MSSSQIVIDISWMVWKKKKKKAVCHATVTLTALIQSGKHPSQLGQPWLFCSIIIYLLSVDSASTVTIVTYSSRKNLTIENFCPLTLSLDLKQVSRTKIAFAGSFGSHLPQYYGIEEGMTPAQGHMGEALGSGLCWNCCLMSMAASRLYKKALNMRVSEAHCFPLSMYPYRNLCANRPSRVGRGFWPRMEVISIVIVRASRSYYT